MPFYEIISRHKQNLISLNFLKKKDKRGNTDVEIIEMLIFIFGFSSCNFKLSISNLLG
jgi:hypothetical protein